MTAHNHHTMTLAKRQSLRLADVYYRWGRDESSDSKLMRSERVKGCSTYWTGSYCPTCGHMAHMHTYGCKDRLCPLCAARKSRALTAQALAVIPFLKGKPVLITLTVRNVAADALDGTIDAMLHAWSLIRKREDVKRGITAWARSLEVTYNLHANTFHPHLHVIAYVASDEYQHLAGWGIWLAMWKDAMRLDYDPQVDVRPITNTTGSVCEVSKYVSKIGFLLSLPDSQIDFPVRVIADTIHGRRLKSYGGDWSRQRRKLRMVDVEAMDDGTLDSLAAQLDKEECCGNRMVPVTLVWAGMEYKVYGEEGDAIESV